MPTLKLTIRLTLCMVAAAVLASVGTAQAQTSTASVVVDHQATTLTRATTRLFAAGPTLFAVTPDGLFRSDDAGTTWRPQPLPPLPPNTSLSLVTVDHTGQTVAFAGPDNKPFVRFSAASPAWQPENLPDQQLHIAALAASPADPDVLYALTSGPWPPTGVPVRLYLSHDGGASWDVIDKPCGAIDGLFAAGGLVQPDASDPQRVFTSINCNGSTGGGAPRSPNIRQSRDQGHTWSDFLKAGAHGVPGIYGDPIGLVGGFAPKPGVYLVSVRADFRLGGSAVLRSVDDGQTWTQVLAFQGGVGGGVTNWTDLPDVSDPGKLAFDPDHPEEIILGPTRASADGGSQWGSIADINLADVATTSNGVFGATATGVVRLSARRVTVQLPETWQILNNAQSGSLPGPVALALSPTGVIVSYGNLPSGGVKLLGFDGSDEWDAPPVDKPSGVAVTSDAQTVYVNDRGYPRALREVLPDEVPVVDRLSQSPQGLALDGGGNLYVTFRAEGRTDTLRLMQVTPSGDILNTWGDSGTDPGQFGNSVWGVAVDASSNIYVADTLNNRVQELAPDGTPVTEWDGLHAPHGVAVDSSGNVYVADTAASRVVELSPDGTQLNTWGDWGTDLGHFWFPMAVAVDPNSGNIYVADTFNNRVVQITPAGQ